MNWFGVKLDNKKDAGSGGSTPTGETKGGGIGKYLPAPASGSNANSGTATTIGGGAGTKRGLEIGTGIADDGKKKRKLGFGNFDGW